MKRQTKRKPKARSKRAGGRTLHVYCVRVTQTRSQDVIVEAENPGQAEGMALSAACRHEHAYYVADPEAAVRSVEMTDGSWAPCGKAEGH